MIIESSAVSSTDELPHLSDVLDLSVLDENLKYLFFQSLRIIWVSALCFLPASLYSLLRSGKEDLVYWFLIGVGCYVLPVSLIYTIVSENFISLKPKNFLKTIIRTFVPYTILLLLGLVIMGLNISVVQFVSFQQPLFNHLLDWLISIYLSFVFARFLGIFYRAYQDRFIGFDKD